MTNEQFAAMNVVNQLFDLAEVPVEKRQAVNDQAGTFVQSIFRHLINNQEKYCKACDIYYVGPKCPQYHPASSPRDLDAIEAALTVANRRTDIFDAAWAAVRRLRAGIPNPAPAPEGLDLEAIAERVRYAEHESDCRLEASPMEATGPRVCTCIVSDAADMLRRLRAGAEGGADAQ